MASAAISKPPRRARRPSLSSDELLDRALDLFLEHGFERTSIETITATAGVAKRTVYLRYGDKKSLFKAALERAIAEWIVPVERLRDAETDDFEASLVAIGQILVDNLLEPAGLRLLRLTNAESVHMPEIGVYSLQRGTDPTLVYLAELFERHLAADGRGDEAGDAAEAFLHLVVGGPANAAALGVVRDKAAIDRRIRYSVHLFLRGLLAGDLHDENMRLKTLLADALVRLDRATDGATG